MTKQTKDQNETTSDFDSEIESTQAKPHTSGHSLLKSCTPSKSIEAKSRQQTIVKRPGANEPFTVSKYNIQLACIVTARGQRGDQYQGEVYHPVTEEIQGGSGSSCKCITFHLCVSVTGEKLLLPQKLSAGSSWNKSMEAVIDAGRKGAITISSDQELQQYSATESAAEIPDTATAEDLEELCNKAFSELIIDRTDHRVLRDTLGLPGFMDY